MTERDLERVLTQSVQDVRLSDTARRRIRQATKEERPVNKMKKFAAIALAAVLMLTASVGLAAELGLFDFLAQKMGQEVLPGANSLVMNDLTSAETAHATYHVRQAAYDGKSASIMVEITPKSENILLLDETWWPEEDLMAWLMPELGDSKQTVAEYAAENSLTIVYATMRISPSDDRQVIDGWDNGVLTLLTSFNATDESLPLNFTFTTFPYMPDGTYEPSNVTASIELTAATPLWTVNHPLNIDLPERGMHIDSISVTGTAIQSYWEIQYTITDVEKASLFYSFDILAPDGELLPRGVLGGGGHPHAKAIGDVLIANAGFGAMNEAPEQLLLRISDPFENIVLYESLLTLK